MRALIVLVAMMLAACGASTPGTSTATPVEPSTAAAASPTATPTAAPTATSEPTTAPTPTPTVDPEAVLDAFFAKPFWEAVGDSFKGDLADAFESDYVMIESIDGVKYDPDKRAITYTFTNDYESVYARDHQEWRDDAWELYRDFARDGWSTLEETIAGELPNATIDWVKWTPALVFSGNKGRLTVSCPGSIIHDVAQRDADQAEWEDACKFKYGRG